MLSWLQQLLGWQCCSSIRLRGEKMTVLLFPAADFFFYQFHKQQNF